MLFKHQRFLSDVVVTVPFWQIKGYVWTTYVCFCVAAFGMMWRYSSLPTWMHRQLLFVLHC